MWRRIGRSPDVVIVDEAQRVKNWNTVAARALKRIETPYAIAGAVGAGACALHQPGSSLPFVSLWYAVPILLCALLGALLGPRVLRW